MATMTPTTMAAFIPELWAKGKRTKVRSEWVPITYSSMTRFMVLNYTLLACMIALPVLIIYALLN